MGREEVLAVRRNRVRLKVAVEGASLTGVGPVSEMAVEFPAGAGYVEKTVRLTW